MQSKRPKLSAPGSGLASREPVTFHLHSQQLLFDNDQTCDNEHQHHHHHRHHEQRQKLYEHSLFSQAKKEAKSNNSSNNESHIEIENKLQENARKPCREHHIHEYEHHNIKNHIDNKKQEECKIVNEEEKIERNKQGIVAKNKRGTRNNDKKNSNHANLQFVEELPSNKTRETHIVNNDSVISAVNNFAEGNGTDFHNVYNKRTNLKTSSSAVNNIHKNTINEFNLEMEKKRTNTHMNSKHSKNHNNIKCKANTSCESTSTSNVYENRTCAMPEPNSSLLVGANAVRVSRLLRDARAAIAPPLRPETPLYTTLPSLHHTLNGNINHKYHSNTGSNSTYVWHADQQSTLLCATNTCSGVVNPSFALTPHRPSRLSSLVSTSLSEHEADKFLSELQQNENDTRRLLEILHLRFNIHGDDHANIVHCKSNCNDNINSNTDNGGDSSSCNLESCYSKNDSNNNNNSSSSSRRNTNHVCLDKRKIERSAKKVHLRTHSITDFLLKQINNFSESYYEWRRGEQSKEADKCHGGDASNKKNAIDWTDRCNFALTIVAILLRTEEVREQKEVSELMTREQLMFDAIAGVINATKEIVKHTQLSEILLTTRVVESILIFVHHHEESVTRLESNSLVGCLLWVLTVVTNKNNVEHTETNNMPMTNEKQLTTETTSLRRSCECSQIKCNTEVCSMLVTLGVVPIMHRLIKFYLNWFHKYEILLSDHCGNVNGSSKMPQTKRSSHSNGGDENDVKYDKEKICIESERNATIRFQIMTNISMICELYRHLARSFASHLCKLHTLELLADLIQQFSINSTYLVYSKSNKLTLGNKLCSTEFLELAQDNTNRNSADLLIIKELYRTSMLIFAAVRSLTKLMFDYDCLHFLRNGEYGTEFVVTMLTTLEQQCNIFTTINLLFEDSANNTLDEMCNEKGFSVSDTINSYCNNEIVITRKNVVLLHSMIISRLSGVVARVIEGVEKHQDTLVLHYTTLVKELVNTFVKCYHSLPKSINIMNIVDNNNNNNSNNDVDSKSCYDDKDNNNNTENECLEVLENISDDQKLTYNSKENNKDNVLTSEAVSKMELRNGDDTALVSCHDVHREEEMETTHSILWLAGIAAMSMRCPLHLVSWLTCNITDFLNKLPRNKFTVQSATYALMCLSNLSFFFSALEQADEEDHVETTCEIKEYLYEEAHANEGNEVNTKQSNLLETSNASNESPLFVSHRITKERLLTNSISKINNNNNGSKDENEGAITLENDENVTANAHAAPGSECINEQEVNAKVQSGNYREYLPTMLDTLGFILCSYLLEGDVECSVEVTRTLANMSYTLAGREWMERNKCDELILLFVAHEDVRIAYNCFGIILNLTAASHCRLVSDPVLLKMLLEYTALYTKYIGPVKKLHQNNCLNLDNVNTDINRHNSTVELSSYNDKIAAEKDSNNSSESSTANVYTERQQIAEIVEKVLQNVYGLVNLNKNEEKMFKEKMVVN